MRVKIIVCILMLLSLAALEAQNISLVSESLPGLGSDLYGFRRYGDYGLFYGWEYHLSIIDLATPGVIAPVATLDLPEYWGPCVDLQLSGHHAYLFFARKIHIVDLSDVRHPFEAGVFTLPEPCRGQVAQDSYLYTVSDSGNLYAYSLQNPLAPQLADVLSLGVEDNRYLFAGEGIVVCQKDSLRIVETSDPTHLRRGGSIPCLDAGDHSPAGVCGKYLYYSAYDTLSVYGLQDPQQPVLLGAVDLDCGSLMHYKHVWDGVLWTLYRDWTDEYCEIGLLGVDVIQPQAPVQISRQQLNFWGGEDLYRFNQFMRGEEDLLYLYYYPYYVQTFALAGGTLTDTGNRYPQNGIGRIAADGDRVAGLNPRIQALEPGSDLTWDATLSLEPATYSTNQIGVTGDLLLCAYSNVENTELPGWYVPALDVYDLSLGVKRGSYAFPIEDEFPVRPCDLRFFQGDALLCNGLGGFYCFDLSDPGQPRPRSVIKEYQVSFSSVAASGNRLWLGSYMYNSWASIWCYDISDNGHPVHSFNLSVSQEPRQMLARGDYLYVLNWDYLRCLQIGSDAVLEQYEHPVFALDASYLLPLGEGLLVGGKKGMQVLSLRDPLHPEVVGYQALPQVVPGYPDDPPYFPSAHYTISGDLVLVANYHVLRCYDTTMARLLCGDSPAFGAGKLFAFPNPARDQVNVCFTAAGDAPASLEIFNLRGQKVLGSVYASPAVGLNLKKIGLVDSSGRRMVAGLYLLRFKQGRKTELARMVVLR